MILTLSVNYSENSVQDSWKESSNAGLLCRKDCLVAKAFSVFPYWTHSKFFSGQKWSLE